MISNLDFTEQLLMLCKFDPNWVAPVSGALNMLTASIPNKKKILSMTLNCIQWWDSSARAFIGSISVLLLLTKAL